MKLHEAVTNMLATKVQEMDVRNSGGVVLRLTISRTEDDRRVAALNVLHMPSQYCGTALFSISEEGLLSEVISGGSWEIMNTYRSPAPEPTRPSNVTPFRRLR